MDNYMIILRLIHIFGGILWAGWVFVLVGFITPAIRAAGSEGGKFLQTLIMKTKISQTMRVAPLLVIFTGLLMYWQVSSGFTGSWIVSGSGLALTIGSLAGILAFVAGFIINRPVTERLAAMSKEMQSSGGLPSPEQMEELRTQQERLSKGGLYVAILLAISVIGMSIARFL